MIYRFTAGRWHALGQIQWAPTLTVHDPNPPITLENAAAADAAALSATGSGTATMAGASEASGAFSSTASATMTMAGAALSTAVMDAQGSGTLTMTGASLATSALAADGTGEAQFEGEGAALPEPAAPVPLTGDAGAYPRRSAFERAKRRRELEREDEELIAIIKQFAPELMQHRRILH